MELGIEGFAAAFKTARQKKGLSQRGLSKKVAMTQSHLSKIENGLVDPQSSTLFELARALELELVLVPRSILPAIQYLTQDPSKRQEQQPMYQLEDDDD